MFNISKIPQLNSECFTYDNYESNWWYLFNMDFEESMDVSSVMRCVEKYAVGYCDSCRLLVRPSTDSYAVMFKKDDATFWFHIPKWMYKCEYD